MSETIITIILFFHVSFAAVWIGGQVLTAQAVIPSIRKIDEDLVRLATIERFTRKFNHIAWGSVVVIIITGGILMGTRIDDANAIAGGGSIYDLRWGFIFAAKMSIFLLMLGVVGLHTFVLGPRLIDLNRRALNDHTAANSSAIISIRRKSIATSGIGLLLSLLVLCAGVFLANHNYSFAAA
jgi:uncharacterized membrane protein